MKFFKCLKFIILITILFCTSVNAWPRHGQPALWQPDAAFGSNWDSFWDATNSSSIVTSGSNVTSWSSTGNAARTATAASTGPTLGTYNGLSALVFSNNTAERLTFSAAGLPSGASDVTIFSCGFAANTTTAKTAISYGGGFNSADTVSIRSLQITGSPTGIQRTTGQYAVASNGQSTASQTQIIWQNNFRIVIGQFLSSSLTKQIVDGDVNLPAYPYIGANNINASKGRIGIAPTDSSGSWDGSIQCGGIITRAITQLEADKLSAWLAWKYNQQASLPNTNPYKNARPTESDSTSSDLIAGIGAGGPMVQKWYDGFSSLSLRSGAVYSGNNTGYNDPNAKGVWAFDGLEYMTSTKGYPGFGQDVFVNSNYNWASVDSTFPSLGMADITSDGLVLKGSEDYPAVRASFTSLTAGPPYLASLLSTTQSTKIGLPFAQRYKWTIPNSIGNYSFPATWSLGDRSNGLINFTGSVTNGNVLTVTSVTSTPPQQPSLVVGGVTYRIQGYNSGLTGWLPNNNMLVSQQSGTTGGAGIYILSKSLDQTITASCSGTVLTVTGGATVLSAGQTLTAGSTVVSISSLGTGTGGNGTYNITPNCGTVSSTTWASSIPAGSSLAAYRNQQELDNMEQFGAENSYSVNSQHNHFFFNSTDQGPPGINFAFNPSTLMTGGSQVESMVVMSSSYVWYLTNGIITARGDLSTISYAPDDLWHAIVNMSTGLSFEPYPGRFNGYIDDGAGAAGNILNVANLSSGHVIVQAGQTVGQSTGLSFTSAVIQPFGSGGTTGTGGAGTYLISGSPQLVGSSVSRTTMQLTNPSLTYVPNLTVRSVEFLAPSYNNTGVFPASQPVPVLSWSACCANGNIPNGTTGTIATLTGANKYLVVPYQVGNQLPQLTVSGSNLTLSSGATIGSYNFYIKGCSGSTCTYPSANSDGENGIAPKSSIVIN